MSLASPLALTLALAAALPVRAGGEPRFVEGELLVGWRDPGSAARAHASARAQLLGRDDRLRLDRVRLPPGASVVLEARRYAREAGVAYAEPNWIIRKSETIPDDALWGDLWGLRAISAPAAWDVRTDGGVVVVAVVDTGIRLDHPDLAGNLWTNAGEVPGNGVDDDGNGIADDVAGARFQGGVATGDPMDDDLADAHGTHVAGIVGAVGNNGGGVAGVSWRARLMAVKVLHGSGGLGTVFDAVRGIRYAVDGGAKVVNCSFAQLLDNPTAPQQVADSAAFADALAYADAHGAMVVTAAGNNGAVLRPRGTTEPLTSLVVPASVRTPSQLGVAATQADGAIAYYSNRGVRTVDVAAPGGRPSPAAEGILSTIFRCDDANGDDVCDAAPAMGYAFLAGTSMAAPHVSGLAALVWSARPQLTHREVKARILNGAVPVPALAGLTITGGRIDAAASLSPALDGMPAVFRVTPYSVRPGDQVTIDGASFGASGTVTVAGVPLAVQSWSDETIVAVVPDGAPSGPVQVNGEGSTFLLSVAGAPTVSLAATPLQGVAPLEVTLAASVVPGDAAIVRYEWDLGDGVLRERTGVTTSAVVSYGLPGSYRARVRATDAAGLSGTAEVSVTATAPGEEPPPPPPPPAPPSSDPPLSDPSPQTELAPAATGGDSRCFVATAAFGSPLDPHVRTLRAFRDRRLLTNAPGRAFVRAYYAVSPPLADVIRRHPALRAVARWALTPVVLGVAHPAGALAALMLGGVAFASVWRRRERRR